MYIKSCRTGESAIQRSDEEDRREALEKWKQRCAEVVARCREHGQFWRFRMTSWVFQAQRECSAPRNWGEVQGT